MSSTCIRKNISVRATLKVYHCLELALDSGSDVKQLLEAVVP